MSDTEHSQKQPLGWLKGVAGATFALLPALFIFGIIGAIFTEHRAMEQAAVETLADAGYEVKSCLYLYEDYNCKFTFADSRVTTLTVKFDQEGDFAILEKLAEPGAFWDSCREPAKWLDNPTPEESHERGLRP